VRDNPVSRRDSFGFSSGPDVISHASGEEERKQQHSVQLVDFKSSSSDSEVSWSMRDGYAQEKGPYVVHRVKSEPDLDSPALKKGKKVSKAHKVREGLQKMLM
jgi:hypothetical protein